MTYQRFEDLPVWQEAIRLAQAIYGLTEHASFERQSSLRDQLERAGVSVSNNIAEGFERGTTSELLAFLYIARGSAGEVRSMLHLIAGLPRFTSLKPQLSKLRSSAESCSRQLRGWAAKLQDSSITGQRRLNTVERQRAEQQKKAKDFLEMLQTKYKRVPFPNPPAE